MKRSVWIIAFAFVLLADVTLNELGYDSFRLITKPLLLPLLFLHFYFLTSYTVSSLKNCYTLALAFCWVGDALLLFERYDPIFFILGLSAFLLGHISFIICFNKLRLEKDLLFKPKTILPVVLYYITLVSLLYNHLGSLLLPVLVYGVAICAMLVMAMNLIRLKNKRAAALIFSGVLAFVLSDSILAINKFYQSFRFAGTIVMLTYGIAQACICMGMVEILNKTVKKTKKRPSWRQQQSLN